MVKVSNPIGIWEKEFKVKRDSLRMEKDSIKKLVIGEHVAQFTSSACSRTCERPHV